MIKSRNELYGLSESTSSFDEDLVFQAVSWFSGDQVVSQDEEEEDADDRKHQQEKGYYIKVFGTQVDGRAVALTITSFTPYFYIDLHPALTPSQTALFLKWISAPQSKLGVSARDILDARFLKKKNFWGFTNGELKPFLRISCKTQRAMRTLCDRLSKLPGKRASVPGISMPIKITLYESNIDPLLRFFHVRDINPAGWIRVHRGKFEGAPATLAAKCEDDFICKWQDCISESKDELAPMLVASFDIECSSSHGDFPVAKKDYRKVAQGLYALFQEQQMDSIGEFTAKETLIDAIAAPFVDCLPAALLTDRVGIESLAKTHMVPAYPKLKSSNLGSIIIGTAKKIVDDVYICLKGRGQVLNASASGAEIRSSIVSGVTQVLNDAFMQHAPLQGDKVIQIGTTFHKYGSRDVCYKYIATLGTCDALDDATVVQCKTERELLLSWANMMSAINPDVVVGWNIFGFDMEYIHDRAEETECVDQVCRMLSRFRDVEKPQRWLKEQRLSSSALGDNFLRYIEMHGRTTIDLMKVIMRDHKLDSYKLDFVAQQFLGQRKNDVSPAEIFKLQRGSSADRKVIADYCVQDCALCNYLAIKLEILANNVGMANVCTVPLSFIFMRGQGVKIFSLIAKQCKVDGFLIPTIKYAGGGSGAEDGGEGEEEEGYEGAIVLDPKPGIYLTDPVSVLDYASLYPSSMISENISHDCFVMDPKYDNLPGVEYLTISYEEGSGDTTRTVSCRFAQIEGKGVLPRILMQLLKQRKATRKRMESVLVDASGGESLQGFYDESSGEFTALNGAKQQLPAGLASKSAYSEFQKAVLDGLQLAYKVTANSLYGQMGARTSPLYLKQIAACTTATGRKMILMAKDFLEKNFNANVVYGDTDSIFVTFPKNVPLGNSGVVIEETGRDAIMPSINLSVRASSEFKKYLKPPHDLEYEKTFWPWIIFSKKRYVGNLYEFDDKKCKQKSMGIVLKRRDNAQIVKKIYGGCIDIILNKQDVGASIAFLKTSLQDLVEGKTPLEDLVITKTLRAEYKNPDQIAHQVLAQRMGERDPGNKPQVNDRVPFVYIETPPPSKGQKVLQGDRIEHPDYIREKKIKPDYRFYITNQITKPVQQLYSLALGSLPSTTVKKSEEYWQAERAKWIAQYDGDAEKADDKVQALKEAEAKLALFDPVLRVIDNRAKNMAEITNWFKPVKKNTA